ncbi:ATP-binding cassette domain-containing protein [Paenibacillus sp. OAS669]|uniref:ATP-binding cassette domain-containing protein n=1 Tax=Paenibacillus sp. OAS669 TaxID=2663821 RepID=UPI00178923DC|nr:ATP-binding cassette domain-containing protein [Paenibacillus sp. OAS669]
MEQLGKGSGQIDMGIVFHDVSYTHAKRTTLEHKAVNGITLSLPDGQFAAIMGPSGSGKTTLGQLAAGILMPESGLVYVDNIPTNSRKLWSDLSNKVAYVSQFPEHQLFEETVFRDIRYGLRRKKYSDQEITAKVKDAMECVGLAFETYKDRSPFQLSGGEQRRAALAGAIVLEPKILVLDEPTAGLDSWARVKFLRLLTHLQRTKHMTIVCITHYLEDALEFADRLVILNNGSLSCDLKPAEIQWALKELDTALSPTPLLRFREELDSLFPGKIDSEIIQENKLFAFITDRLMRT